ncbi:transcriptional regulator, LuxR family [Thermoanaerobacter kivui]|uniref:Transcriptional regulator, LuxR family n=1 Tax=Thermoanaerobacter kivui TaxID=2325 RepID=A0A097AU82_THEKI|nr:LuxR C-terminal-related transcriptional regulator [Thermoanaerobacter kivui]AIS53387.1 transcriptional regulator, LuxR family [Thermoanaerobacter kivui]
MGEVIRFDTHKGLFEQSWGRCLKRGLTPDKKLVALNNVKIVEDSKRYSLIKAFRKSIKDLKDINDFRNFIFLLTDKEGVILELNLPHVDIDFYLKKGMVLKKEIAGTNAVSLAIREKNIAVVRKEQHYIEDLKRLNCTAGPIFDKEGNLIGIVDISSENEFNDNLVAVVFLIARYIERNYQEFEMERIKKKFDEIDTKILKLTAEGKTDKEIAKTINMSLSNIKYHKRKIFKLLGTKNVKDCIYKATKLDLI